MDDNNILLVDDEPNVIKAIKRALIDEPYTIFSATGARQGLEILAQHPVKVVVSDEGMPGMKMPAASAAASGERR